MIFSAVMVAGGLKAGWAGDYSFTCQPIDYSDDPKVVSHNFKKINYAFDLNFAFPH